MRMSPLHARVLDGVGQQGAGWFGLVLHGLSLSHAWSLSLSLSLSLPLSYCFCPCLAAALQVEAALGVPVSQQRFWTWHRRPNGTWRPTDPLKGTQDKTMVDLRQHRVQHPVR
jgi:hypothetical protein